MRSAISSKPLDASSRLGDELLLHFSKQAPRIPVPVILVTLLVTSMTQGAPRWLTLGWIALVAAMLVVRTVVTRRMQRDARLAMQTRLNIVAVVSVASGVVHGMSVLFWPYLTELQRSIQTLVVMGLCAANIASNMGYPRTFIAYLVPTMAPTVWQWARALAPEGGPWYGGEAGLMLALFLVQAIFLIVLARDTFRLFRESFEARQRLRVALDEAEAANRSKTRFLASASHDLRQPMHTLSLFAAALTMRPLDAPSREIAKHMDTAVQGLSSQLDDLLDVSKLDAGVVPVRTVDFAVEPMLRRLFDEFEPVARRKGLRMTLRCAADAGARSDPMLLERVVRNLVDNAIKYTQTGSIAVYLDDAGADFALCIRDTGAGIPRDEQTRVFEEFYQLGNPERDRAQGLGLGLSIVKRLAELLALRLTMRSATGVGTTFELRLARTPGRASKPEAPATGAADIRGLHVLVIDDEEAVRGAMQTLLDGFGCRCSLAAGTSAALAAARAARPDIVIADLRLRGEDDGIAAVRAVRELHPELPALLVSGDTAPARLRDAHTARLRLLHKPVPVDALTRAIREEVDRNGGSDDGAASSFERERQRAWQ